MSSDETTSMWQGRDFKTPTASKRWERITHCPSSLPGRATWAATRGLHSEELTLALKLCCQHPEIANNFRPGDSTPSLRTGPPKLCNQSYMWSSVSCCQERKTILSHILHSTPCSSWCREIASQYQFEDLYYKAELQEEIMKEQSF